MSNKADILKELYEVRNTIEAGWTQKTMARSKDGRVVGYLSKDAASFCILGAMAKTQKPMLELYRALCNKHERGVAAFNDAPGRKKEDIISIIDKVISEVGGHV